MVKRVNESHRVPFHFWHSEDWRSCTILFIPDFVPKTQNPSVLDQRFDEFTIPLLDDFVSNDKSELLLCLIRTLRKYLSRTKQYHPGIDNLFICTGQQKKVSQNTISWLRSIIFHAYSSASAEDCRDLQVRAHEVQKVAALLLFWRNYAVHQVLKVLTRSF